MTKFLGKAEILAAPDLVYDEVPVPEWGGAVRVRGMTGSERDAWELAQMETKAEQVNIRATLLAFTIVDEEGKRVFTVEDVVALGAKSAKALQRVFRVARKLSRISEEDVKELEKNSEGAPGGALPSSSPAS